VEQQAPLENMQAENRPTPPDKPKAIWNLTYPRYKKTSQGTGIINKNLLSVDN
jgi:hypothetical protein